MGRTTIMTIIPKILHMIWLGEKERPEYFDININRWKDLMPSWDFKIWTNEHLTEEYIEKSYLQLINKASKGAQKADLLRYYMVYKYGGFYVDADVTPLKSLDFIKTYNYSTVICNDRPWITWAYISIGFFGSVKESEFLKFIIDNMYKVDLENKDIHLTTGPAALGLAYFNLREKISCLVLPYFYFYRNKVGDIGPGSCADSKFGVYLKDNIDEALGHHFYAATWV
jgi:mannosyltransferase OCH1-like enzyme